MQIASERGEYEILETLRKNGKFGSVYRGEVKSNQQPVIVKQLSAGATPEKIVRFHNEFRLAVQHPHLIAAIDCFTANGMHYLIRPYITGVDASAFIRKKSISTTQLVSAANDILSAIQHLHTQGILHTDIKPSNIILSEMNGQLRAYLTDLGLARKINEPEQRRPFALLYSPPEQVLQYHSLMNATSDIYSLGITLYELISGHAPFRDSNPEFIMHLQMTQSIEPHKKINKDMLSFLQKATAKPRFLKPANHYSYAELEYLLTEAMAQRYQSAGEMLTDLNTLPIPTETKSRWRKWFYS